MEIKESLLGLPSPKRTENKDLYENNLIYVFSLSSKRQSQLYKQDNDIFVLNESNHILRSTRDVSEALFIWIKSQMIVIDIHIPIPEEILVYFQQANNIRFSMELVPVKESDPAVAIYKDTSKLHNYFLAVSYNSIIHNNKYEFIEILSHELVHVLQFEKQDCTKTPPFDELNGTINDLLYIFDLNEINARLTEFGTYIDDVCNHINVLDTQKKNDITKKIWKDIIKIRNEYENGKFPFIIKYKMQKAIKFKL